MDYKIAKGGMIDLIGNTPIVEINKINGNRIYAKLEYYNPTGSVKDRAALYMISGALSRGDLQVGGVIVEPTSGNTGIGLALIAKRLGIKVVLTMPSSMSIERRQILVALGAEIVLTDPAEGMKGAIARAEEIVKTTKGGYMPMQFCNTDGALAHYKTTAPEIFKKIEADYIVAGVGSGGTIMGIKSYILDKGKSTKVVAVEPQESPLLSGGTSASHGIQGIGANFIPQLVDIDKIDKVITINTLEAKKGAKMLALNHGIMSGISGGASYMAAVKLAEEIEGKSIVFIVPDGALKYLSNDIYG